MHQICLAPLISGILLVRHRNKIKAVLFSTPPKILSFSNTKIRKTKKPFGCESWLTINQKLPLAINLTTRYQILLGMSEEEGFDSRERLLSPEELADCVTRQKEFSLPTVGAKVRCTLNFVLITKYIF